MTSPLFTLSFHFTMLFPYNEHSKMSDIISGEPTLLQMMSRFGIPLGVGERTVEEVCRASSVDVSTFLAVASFIKHDGHIDNSLSRRVSVTALVSYLQRAHSYFLDFQLPGIRRRLLEAIDCSGADEVAFLILKFYDEYMGEVRRHMTHENSKIFTYTSRLEAGRLTEGYSIERYERSHSAIDKKLQELKNIIIKYYTPQGSSDPLVGVLLDIYNCEADLRMHCAIEDQLFIPAVRSLEQKLLAAGADSEREGETNVDTNTETLSEREREIVACVVRGMTNKEVADRLFISVNTVQTHRKNIARKLGVHSVSGLTIYAIVNKIVDVAEMADKMH